jgi:hypothetical protein
MIWFACVGTIQQPGTQLDLDLLTEPTHSAGYRITADSVCVPTNPRQTRSQQRALYYCIDRALCVRAEQGLLSYRCSGTYEVKSQMSSKET